LFVNVLGSLLIGMLAPLAVLGESWLSLPQARAFLIVGVCGGFTTFSSFSIETLNLARTGYSLLAVTYVLTSVLLCLLAVAIGYYVTSTVFR